MIWILTGTVRLALQSLNEQRGIRDAKSLCIPSVRTGNLDIEPVLQYCLHR